jgi:hypothetical protein
MELYDIAQELAAEFENPILIGGIAAIESGYTAESTKDVDMIVVVHERYSAAQVLEDFTVTSQAPRGEKGRGIYCGIHVDVYFEHQSYLGSLAQLDVALIAQYRGKRVGNWILLTPPAQFATKVAALLDRAGTLKGRRDANTLYAMILSSLSPEDAREAFLNCSSSSNRIQLWEQACADLSSALSTNTERDTVRSFFRTR